MEYSGKVVNQRKPDDLQLPTSKPYAYNST